MPNFTGPVCRSGMTPPPSVTITATGKIAHPQNPAPADTVDALTVAVLAWAAGGAAELYFFFPAPALDTPELVSAAVMSGVSLAFRRAFFALSATLITSAYSLTSPGQKIRPPAGRPRIAAKVQCDVLPYLSSLMVSSFRRSCLNRS